MARRVGLALAVLATAAIAVLVAWAVAPPVALHPPGLRLLGQFQGDPQRVADKGQAHAEIAGSPEAVALLRAALRISASAPAVELDREVLVAITSYGGSTCPSRLRALTIAGASIVAEVRTDVPLLGGCTGDLKPYTVLVAVPRAALPPMPFPITITADPEVLSGYSVIAEIP